MGNGLAFAMLLIHQHQAQNLNQQQSQQHLFLTFLEGHVTAEQYERDLDLTLPSDLRTRSADTARARLFGTLRRNAQPLAERVGS